MEPETPEINQTAQSEDAMLDRLLGSASFPDENPWLATQVLNRLRHESPLSRPTFWHKFRAFLSTPLARISAGVFVTALSVLLFLNLIPDSDFPSNSNSTATLQNLDGIDISDELIVEDLEIFMAELNSDLWQNEISL